MNTQVKEPRANFFYYGGWGSRARIGAFTGWFVKPVLELPWDMLPTFKRFSLYTLYVDTVLCIDQHKNTFWRRDMVLQVYF